MLLERQAPLEQLAAARERALDDGGQAVLISGPAGIGKTKLIEAFVHSMPDGTPVHRGGCEALFAARPLGPLFDFAEELGGEFAELLGSGADNHSIYSTFLALIEKPEFAGAVFVIEDIHWADNGTMDFLKFIGRRMAKGRCLLLASYRDDEIGATHPLHFVLGDLPGDSTVRIKLQPLSLTAIRELGGGDERRSREILDITGGNPFFVHELLSSDGTGVPATVTEAVLAKAARLSPDARNILNLVSVVPGKCELLFLESAFGNALELLDECADNGLLTVDRNFAAFHHELARLAIEDALPAGQRGRWNTHMLDALRRHRPDAAARLAHHADMSGDENAVLRYAPPAAEQAAKLGAHREAVTLYRQALNNAAGLENSERADLLGHFAYELYVTGNIEDAIDARLQALTLWDAIGDDRGVARSHRWLSRLYWFVGRRAEADRYAEMALAVGQERQGSSQYAMACSNRAQLYMLSSDMPRAVEWANRAIELAEAEDDKETLVHALNNLGAALSSRRTDDGLPHLRRSLEMALQNDFQEHVARAYTNITSNLVGNKHYEEAARYFDAGIDYSAERDLDSWLYYMQGWRARLRLETGDWDGAQDDAETVLRDYRGAVLVASPAMSALARLRVRRGDPESGIAIDRAWEAIADTDELQRIAPLVAARAERAWLLGEPLDDIESLIATRDWAMRLEQPWLVGELNWWASKLGLSVATQGEVPEPYERILAAGDWAGAARAWERIGCPYEMAMALAEGDLEAQRQALEIFTNLGAAPAAALLRKSLRARGVKDLPTESRRSTRTNPAGLTNRQLAVLEVLCEGLSDAEIAARLFISPRTVSHHVSAILGKLGVQSRAEAAAVARNRRIGSKNRQPPGDK